MGSVNRWAKVHSITTPMYHQPALEQRIHKRGTINDKLSFILSLCKTERHYCTLTFFIRFQHWSYLPNADPIRLWVIHRYQPHTFICIYGSTMSAEGRMRISFTEILLPFYITMSVLITDQNPITLKKMQWENLVHICNATIHGQSYIVETSVEEYTTTHNQNMRE